MVSGYPAPRCGLRPGHPVAAIAGYAPAAGALGGNAGHAGRSGRGAGRVPERTPVAGRADHAVAAHARAESVATPAPPVWTPAFRSRPMAPARRPWRHDGVLEG